MGVFLISGILVNFFLIKRNRHNSKTTDDIDMKLNLVTNLDNANKIVSNKT